MDPQQRLVLENVYHALENAGMPMANAVGSNTSVYVTGFNHDYLRILDSDPEVALRYKPTGTTNSILSNRVSWFFDFKGPSMTVDTACSSSLVALHLAVQSLRSRESNMVSQSDRYADICSDTDDYKGYRKRCQHSRKPQRVHRNELHRSLRTPRPIL